MNCDILYQDIKGAFQTSRHWCETVPEGKALDSCVSHEIGRCIAPENKEEFIRTLVADVHEKAALESLHSLRVTEPRRRGAFVIHFKYTKSASFQEPTCLTESDPAVTIESY
jgi:hypothetical protein